MARVKGAGAGSSGGASMRVLVVNAGSSSIKLRLLDEDDAIVWETDLAAPDPGADGPAGAKQVADLADAVDRAVDPWRHLVEAVGHRVVHGGTVLTRPRRIDAGVEQTIAELVPLAPLHQGRALAGIRAARRVLSATPQVACFDTAFFAGLPAAAATYAVPARWRDQLGVRRFGFHGLSHAYAVRRGGDLAGRTGTRPRAVSCHLGAGASAAAVLDGRAVDTTMGFTPLEGLVMATRSGTVDPGALVWLAGRSGGAPGLPVAEIGRALEHESGLLGLAGTADMAEVVARAGSADPDATVALDVVVHRLRAAVAAMAAAAGGLDLLVFTGGVGENAPVVRARAAAGLGFLGVDLDDDANDAARADADVSAPSAPVATVVVTAREDVEVAKGVRELLA